MKKYVIKAHEIEAERWDGTGAPEITRDPTSGAKLDIYDIKIPKEYSVIPGDWIVRDGRHIYRLDDYEFQQIIEKE